MEKMEIYQEGGDGDGGDEEREKAENKIRLNQGWTQFMNLFGGRVVLF